MDVRCHIVVHTWIPHWVMITQVEVPIWFRSLQVIFNMSWQTAVCVCKALEIDATRINLHTGVKMSSVNSSCLINYLPFFCAFLINFWYSASHCLNPKFYLFINIIHQSFCQTILIIIPFTWFFCKVLWQTSKAESRISTKSWKLELPV